MDLLTQCPVCGANNFNDLLRCKDYTVSHETFTIQKCTCGLLLTNPRPEDAQLSRYYDSQDYISHSETTTGFINKLYLAARKITLRWKLGLVKEYSRGHNILDVGCGTGEFLRTCQDAGFEVSGVEISEAARAKAEAKLNKKLHASLDQIAKAEFHLITLWHVLEHLPNLNNTLEQLKQNLHHDGRILIAVPNHGSFDAKHYANQWAAYDVPRHLWHFNQETMNLLVSRHDLKLEKITGMKLDSFYVSMLSEKYQRQGLSVIYLFKAICIAALSNFKALFSGNYSSLIYIIRK